MTLFVSLSDDPVFLDYPYELFGGLFLISEFLPSLLSLFWTRMTTTVVVSNKVSVSPKTWQLPWDSQLILLQCLFFSDSWRSEPSFPALSHFHYFTFSYIICLYSTYRKIFCFACFRIWVRESAVMFSRGEADLHENSQREDKQALSMEQLPTLPHEADMCICTRENTWPWPGIILAKGWEKGKEKRLCPG